MISKTCYFIPPSCHHLGPVSIVCCLGKASRLQPILLLSARISSLVCLQPCSQNDAMKTYWVTSLLCSKPCESSHLTRNKTESLLCLTSLISFPTLVSHPLSSSSAGPNFSSDTSRHFCLITFVLTPSLALSALLPDTFVSFRSLFLCHLLREGLLTRHFLTHLPFFTFLHSTYFVFYIFYLLVRCLL